MNTIITFEDTGQDFLRWLVSPSGEVLDCAPMQSWLWTGRKVLATQNRKIDGRLVLILEGEDGGDYFLKHVVLNLENTSLESLQQKAVAA